MKIIFTPEVVISIVVLFGTSAYGIFAIVTKLINHFLSFFEEEEKEEENNGNVQLDNK